jgi:LysR family glycine cleavage system transcriptional activator
VRDNADETLLRLKLPPTFAIRWLAPRLYRFQALYPDIEMQITTSHAPGDFEREDVDIFVHSESGPPSGEGYRRLLGQVLLPVCSRRLLERGPPLREPADLSRHVLLSSSNRPRDWPLWLAAAGVQGLETHNAMTFDNAALAYQAAIDALGVVMAQQALIQDELDSGRLVAPLPRRVPTQGAYYLAFHPHRPKAPRVAAFEAWLMAEAAGS